MEVFIISAPYKRTYQHTKNTGKESTVRCSFCGKITPKWKAFSQRRGFRIKDPTVRKQVDKRRISAFSKKQYACPSCARFRGIIQKGRSRKSRSSQKKRRR